MTIETPKTKSKIQNQKKQEHFLFEIKIIFVK